MDKSKMNSEKLLLGLGGAGIVAAVAVIVFLITFNIGGPKPTKNETTSAPQQTTIPYMVGGGTTISYVEETEGISEVTDVVIDASCRDAVKVFADCIIYGNTAELEKLLPSAAWSKLASDSGVEKQAMIDVFKAYLEQVNVAAQFDENGSVTHEVSNVLVIEDASAQEIRSAVSSAHGIDISSITDVYAVTMRMDYTKNGEGVSEVDELFCVKIDGVWYLAEKDYLAVYGILEGIIKSL
jgi:hypothetical protein